MVANTLSWSQGGPRPPYHARRLTHATQLYRLTKHETLRATIETALKALQLYQAADGYLGPFPDAKGADGLRTMSVGWDPWGHYHIMYGCLLWHDATGSAGAIGIATKIGGLMTTTFPGSDPQKFFSQGSLEQNMAILHSMACLYSKTRGPELRVFCEMVCAELQIPPAGDYIRNALKKQEFYQGSQPRWEALCGIIGFAELYHAAGDPDLAASYQQIWWSLCEFERHNQGGMMVMMATVRHFAASTRVSTNDALGTWCLLTASVGRASTGRPVQPLVRGDVLHGHLGCDVCRDAQDDGKSSGCRRARALHAQLWPLPALALWSLVRLRLTYCAGTSKP